MEETMRNGHGPKIVVIGGGTGVSNIMKGLKKHNASLNAVVTMFDSGGSSGVLRNEFGYPPFGDLRQCLLALSDEAQGNNALREALEFRFGNDSSLNGHSVGNLLLAALTSLSDDVEQAIEEISRLLHVTGQVIPVTLDRAELCAELEDGRIIRGESDIDLRATPHPRIKRIFLDNEVQANPRAIKAIMEADGIVLGPGDLYTSILPNLLPEGVVDALASRQATLVYVCNLMTKPGETDEFKASDFVREVKKYLGPSTLDWAVVNTGVPTLEVQYAYEAEGAYLVMPDLDEVNWHARGVLAASLATSQLPLRHDSLRTADAVMQTISAGRVNQYSYNQVSSIPVQLDSD